jgi:hypothetical protein
MNVQEAARLAMFIQSCAGQTIEHWMIGKVEGVWRLAAVINYRYVQATGRTVDEVIRVFSSECVKAAQRPPDVY